MSSVSGQVQEDIFVFNCACRAFTQCTDKKGSIQFGPGRTELWDNGSEHTYHPVLHQGEKIGWVPFNDLGSYWYRFSFKDGEKPSCWGGYKWFKLSKSNWNPAEKVHKCAAKEIVWGLEEMKHLLK